jgi:hypothetical protein
MLSQLSYKLNCLTCGSYVNAEKVNSYKMEVQDEHPIFNSWGGTVTTYNEFTFLKCPQCFQPFLTCTEYCNGSESYNDFEYAQVKTLYPISNTSSTYRVPTYIRKSFQEAFLCLNAKAFSACIAMCIKTIESICEEHKIEGNSLKEKLEIMRQQEIINHHLYNWASNLKLQDLSCEVDINFNQNDAQQIVELTDLVIEYIFRYRKNFELFKKTKLGDK